MVRSVSIFLSSLLTSAELKALRVNDKVTGGQVLSGEDSAVLISMDQLASQFTVLSQTHSRSGKTCAKIIPSPVQTLKKSDTVAIHSVEINHACQIKNDLVISIRT